MGYTKYVQSNDLLEVYNYEKNLPERRKRSRKKRDNTRYKHYRSRSRNNVKRCSQKFIRIVRANLVGTECPTFLTLTMASVVRIDLAFQCFTGFIERCRVAYGKEWRYVAVPEFQARGAVHFHVLVWGIKITPDEERLNRYYQRLWSHGTCDLISTDGSPKIAGYMAKYMRKALYDERLFSQKGYVRSRNTLSSVSLNFSSAVAHEEMIWGEKELTYEKEFDTLWLGRCIYKSYKIKQ